MKNKTDFFAKQLRINLENSCFVKKISTHQLFYSKY
jgi:hypothetical protein